MPVRFGGGGAFVPEMDREVGLFAEHFGEGLGIDGLGAENARHVEWISYYDLHATMVRIPAGATWHPDGGWNGPGS
jgi:hypothetical protein